MQSILALGALIAPLLSCHFLLYTLKPKGIAERFIFSFCLFSAHIVIFGYVLSSISRLGDVHDWFLLGLIAALISAMTVVWNRGARNLIALPRFRFVSLADRVNSIKNWYTKDLSCFEKLILSPLILTVLLLGILNLAVVVFTAPSHWDGLAYHLARMAYYLQHNSINYFGANYWAQDLHPKNSSLLLLYTYLISGRNENLTQLVQFISYWVAVCSVYAISRKVGSSKAQSMFAAMVSALLIEWLMQATTTQNDLIITAYFGATVYFLFAFREAREWRYLGFAALGLGLSIGTKASSLLVWPSVALVVLYIFFQWRAKPKYRWRILSVFVSGALFAICIFALPAGYMENYRVFGHPIGPSFVRKLHSFEGKPMDYIFRNGPKNLVRFGFEFLSLDGMPPIALVGKMQSVIKAVPAKMVRSLGMDLGSFEAAKCPFFLHKRAIAHEDLSYWGIFGFGLVWIMVFLSLIGVVKSTDMKVLSLASVVFLFAQAYAGPYDPWRGRFFTTCAIFAIPIIGISLRATHWFVRAYLIFIVLAGCVSAVSAVVFRQNSALISTSSPKMHAPSVFNMNRMEQLTRNRKMYSRALAAFDQLVPSDATVAVFLYGDSYEYPLFGNRLTRTIIPVNSFTDGFQSIPPNAEYFLYTQKGFPCPASTDVHLGADWYLRKLTKGNRRCS